MLPYCIFPLSKDTRGSLLDVQGGAEVQSQT